MTGSHQTPAARRNPRPLIAGGMIATGLVLEAICLGSFSPGTFVVFAMVGAPLAVLGMLYFAGQAISVAVRWSGR